MTATDRTAIDAFLSGHRIAFVGISTHPKDFSRAVDRELQAEGYEVVPVHPGVTEIDGRRAYARVSEIPEPVDGVLVMVPAKAVLSVVQDCVKAGKPRLWLHRGIGPGSVTNEAVALARAEGFELVVGECPLMFLAIERGPHRVHALAKKLAGSYPYRASTFPASAPLSLGSALSLLAFDWAIYAITLLTGLRALPVVTGLGAAAVCLATVYFEGRRENKTKLAVWSTGFAAAIAVAVPLPLVGSLIGTATLFWLALSALRREHGARATP